jgi:NTE family protein
MRTKTVKKKTPPKKKQSKRRQTYGLVLSGGAALGSYQAGAIRALYEAGLDIRCVAGSSIGALNGYLAATREIDRMIAFWKNIDQKKLITIQSFTKLFFSGSTSLLTDQMQRNLVEEAVSLATLQKSGIAYICAAISIHTGKLHYFRGSDAQTDRELRDFILASAAVPGVFPPVKIGEELYIDGGLVRNTPVEALEGERVDCLIAISMEPEYYPEEKISNTAQIALRTLSIFFRSQADDAIARSLASRRRRAKRVLLLRPQLPLDMQQYEFDPKKIEQLIEQGYTAASQFIARHGLR